MQGMAKPSGWKRTSSYSSHFEITVQGFAANQYGAKKERGYKEVMEEKMLDLDYHSFTLGSFGSFGKGTWNVINLACDPDTHPGAGGDYDPWMLPGPKRDFVISIYGAVI